MDAVKTVESKPSAPSQNPKEATSFTSPPPIPFFVRINNAKKKAPPQNAADNLSRNDVSERRVKRIPSKAKGNNTISKIIYCSQSVTTITAKKKAAVTWKMKSNGGIFAQ